MLAKHLAKATGVIVFLWVLLGFFSVKRLIFDEMAVHNASLLFIGMLALLGTERFKNAKNNLDYAVSGVSFVLALYIAFDLITA